MITTDPNWLLSTTAQSSAALVGIIGGLLVSRLVALSSERSGLQRQRREDVERRDWVTTEVEKIDAEFVRDVEEDFALKAADDAIELRGSITASGLVARYHKPNVYGNEEAALRLATELIARVEDAYSQLAAAEAQHGAEIIDPARLDHYGIIVPEGPACEYVYWEVAQRRRAERVPSDTRLQLTGGGKFTARQQAASPERIAMAKRRQALADELRQLNDSIAVSDRRIARLGGVRSMTPVLVVLAGFSLVGVVQPIVMLALRPPPESALARTWVVFSFTVALLMLLFFLWREVRGLTSSKSSEDEP